MKVSVTQKDILKGRQRDPQGCPVALAIQRGGVTICCVAGPAVIVRGKRPNTQALLLPESVQRWIRRFDEHRAVDPISFELGLPVLATCRCEGETAIDPDCPRLKS